MTPETSKWERQRQETRTPTALQKLSSKRNLIILEAREEIEAAGNRLISAFLSLMHMIS
jgi:hypothetical protein